MAGDKTTQDSARVGDRFPALKRLEEDVERAKLDQALAEARSKALRAKLPSLDVDVERDAVDISEKSSGLARVLVQTDTVALADDIADLALEAARAATKPQGNSYSYVIRVVGDRAVFAGVDVYRLLEAQLSRLVSRIDEYAALAKKQSKAKEGTEAQARGLPSLIGVAAAAGVAVQTLGSASKSYAHDHRISGREVPVDDLGFDLEVAHHLTTKERSDESLTVEVDSLAPTLGSSKILDRIWGLASITEQRLLPALGSDASVLAGAEARANDIKGSIIALNAEILELTKHVTEATRRTPVFLRQRTEQRKTLEDDLPEIGAAVTQARNRYELGCQLLRDVEDFLTTALAPQPGGVPPPALEASRAEDLAAPDRPSYRAVRPADRRRSRSGDRDEDRARSLPRPCRCQRRVRTPWPRRRAFGLRRPLGTSELNDEARQPSLLPPGSTGLRAARSRRQRVTSEDRRQTRRRHSCDFSEGQAAPRAG